MSVRYIVPGERICHSSECIQGSGTYVAGGYVHSSLVGTVQSKNGNEGELPTISVIREKETTIIPDVGHVVIGKVLKVTPKLAQVAILVVESIPLKEPFRGIIRVQDIRETEKDKVQIYKSFRPGDIVRCQVISLGDARSYYLSTAKNEFGVIFARSEAGVSMVPISWQEMQCPKTKVKEFRKCAKPLQ